jgi:hypothetical protein
LEVNGLDWQSCLAGSSKTAPRILIFSIAMDADSSFYVKFIATYAPTFLGFVISVLAMVPCLDVSEKGKCIQLMRNISHNECTKVFKKSALN